MCGQENALKNSTETRNKRALHFRLEWGEEIQNGISGSSCCKQELAGSWEVWSQLKHCLHLLFAFNVKYVEVHSICLKYYSVIQYVKLYKRLKNSCLLLNVTATRTLLFFAFRYCLQNHHNYLYHHGSMFV